MAMQRYLQTAFLISAIGLTAICQELAAQEAVPSLTNPTTDYLETISESQFEMQFQMVEQSKRTAEVRLTEAKTRIEELHNKRADLLKQQSDLGVSSASYDEIMRLLQTQKVQLTIDLAGIEARREAMIEQNESQRAIENETNGSVAQPLQELVAIQHERLQQVEALREKGAAPHAEVLDAKQQLLEVQVRLAEVTGSGGGAGGKPLDHELLNVSLARAETVARLHKVNQLLEEYVGARTPIDTLARVQSDISVVEALLSNLNTDVARRDDQLSNMQMLKQRRSENRKSAQEEKDNDREQ